MHSGEHLMESTGHPERDADELERLLRELQYMETYWEQQAAIEKNATKTKYCLRRRDGARKLAADLRQEAARTSSVYAAQGRRPRLPHSRHGQSR